MASKRRTTDNNDADDVVKGSRPRGATAKTMLQAKAKPTTKKTAAPRANKKTAAAAKIAKPKSAKPTLASIAAQLALLSEQVAALTQMLSSQGREPSIVSASAKVKATRAPSKKKGGASKKNGASSTTETVTPDTSAFEADLLSAVGQIDRRGRYGGVIPIPEVRSVFAERGWTRSAFDSRLLQAERDFVVDLKTANDPSRLAEPDLAIKEPGRGHLQYVVVR